MRSSAKPPRYHCNRLAKTANIFFVAPRLNSLESALSHSLCSLRRCDRFTQRLCEGRDVACGEDASFDPIRDQVGLATHVVGDDYSSAGVHDLIHDQTPGFMLRR